MQTILLLISLFLLASCHEDELHHRDEDCRKLIYPISSQYEKERTETRQKTVKLVCYDTGINSCAVLGTETETSLGVKKETWFYQNVETGEILRSASRDFKEGSDSQRDGERIENEVTKKMHCFD